MTPLVVVILALMWTLVLVPPLLRSRADGRPLASVSSFRRQLSTLQRTGPVVRRDLAPSRVAMARPAPVRFPHHGARAPMARRITRDEARRRRQNVLLGLVGFAFLTAVAGFGLGIPAFVVVHVAVDVLLVLYVYLLVQIRRVQEQRAARYSWSTAA